MTQDNPLARSHRLPSPVQVEEIWGPPVNAASLPALSATAPPQPQPFRKIHRLLRGRYAWAIALSLVCAALGGALGYFSQTPKYRSNGYIYCQPTIPSLSSAAAVMPMYPQYVATQAQILQSQRVIQAAMQDPDWQALGRGADSKALRDFEDSLFVRRSPDSSLITVSYLDPSPQAAQTAVRSIIRAYNRLYGDMNGASRKERTQFARSQLEKATNQISYDRNLIVNQAQNYGTPENVATVQSSRLAQMLRTQQDLADSKLTLAMATESANSSGFDPAKMTLGQLADVDPELGKLVDQQSDLSNQLQVMTGARNLGENAPAVKAIRIQLQQFDRDIQKRVDEFRQHYAQSVAAGIVGAPGQSQSIPLLKMRISELEESLKQQQAGVNEIGNIAAQIARINLDIEQQQQIVDRMNGVLEQLAVEDAMSGKTVVQSEADLPVAPDVDKRIPAAVLGTIAGGALPLLLILMAGLLGQRIRYSDETTPETAGVTLLGILPNLPDLLTSPEQASIAAHCVHQVRTMLQLTGEGRQRRVYAITSASPGDGKTSLALALGLSFAASGCRTLLIDCDLVGGGLTRRLNVATPEGILEALNTRSLLDYVQNLDITDLALLPIGAAHAHHASSFSPLALERIIAEGRKHYDIVLIDTGPILGSIEAAPVAAAADGVILAVARGQQRPLVDKALCQLGAIHATVAGVVFNRASGTDVEQSMSRRSIRAVARGTDGAFASPAGAAAAAVGNGGGGGADAEVRSANGYGPVAHAVAKSFNPGNGDAKG